MSHDSAHTKAQILHKLADALLARNLPEELNLAIEYYQAAAEREKNPSFQAVLLKKCGDALQKRNSPSQNETPSDFDQAFECYIKAVALFEDPIFAYDLIYELTTLIQAQSTSRKNIIFLIEYGAKLLDRLPTDEGKANFLNSLGLLHFELHKITDTRMNPVEVERDKTLWLNRAITALEKAIVLCPKEDLSLKKALYFDSIVLLLHRKAPESHMQKSDVDLVIERATEALGTFQWVANDPSLMGFVIFLVQALIRRNKPGDLENAIAYCDRAINMTQNQRDLAILFFSKATALFMCKSQLPANAANYLQFAHTHALIADTLNFQDPVLKNQIASLIERIQNANNSTNTKKRKCRD